MASARIEHADDYQRPPTLDPTRIGPDDSTAGRTPDAAPAARNTTRTTGGEAPTSWTCATCTYVHAGASKRLFLACELCGASLPRPRSSTVARPTAAAAPVAEIEPPPPPPGSPVVRPASVGGSAWGGLRAPSDGDVRGPRKRRKALERRPPVLDYIIVLDFEWTADNKRKMEPVAEITQFPSVVMKLVDANDGLPSAESLRSFAERSPVPLPVDLTPPVPHGGGGRRDAYAVSIFDSFVRPTLNPTLTPFSIALTAITQAQVDAAPSVQEVLHRYTRWLASLHLIDGHHRRLGNWCFATWGDVDIATTLRLELAHKSIDLPGCFDRWINLKDASVFRRHYGREPRGGLRACVESVGAKWEGRAHDGLVDSVNTAKIVRDMVRGGFRFVRPTRGLDGDGVPFGQRRGTLGG